MAAIRARLDEAGHVNTPIMSYAVKDASNFYSVVMKISLWLLISAMARCTMPSEAQAALPHSSWSSGAGMPNSIEPRGGRGGYGGSLGYDGRPGGGYSGPAG